MKGTLKDQRVFSEQKGKKKVMDEDVALYI